MGFLRYEINPERDLEIVMVWSYIFFKGHIINIIHVEHYK
jgi:hypothetical protein